MKAARQNCQQKCQQKITPALSGCSSLNPAHYSDAESNSIVVNSSLRKTAMKQRFRIYRRNGGRFYVHDSVTGKQESLGTSDRTTATRLLHSKNEASHQPAINLPNRPCLSCSD